MNTVKAAKGTLYAVMARIEVRNPGFLLMPEIPLVSFFSLNLTRNDNAETTIIKGRNSRIIKLYGRKDSVSVSIAGPITNPRLNEIE